MINTFTHTFLQKVKAVLEGGMASYRAAGLPLASTTRINLVRRQVVARLVHTDTGYS